MSMQTMTQQDWQALVVLLHNNAHQVRQARLMTAVATTGNANMTLHLNRQRGGEFIGLDGWLNVYFSILVSTRFTSK
ncbi:MAG: hypothetical protein ACREOZ_00730 [Gloeomargaritales cyanobacterium]